MQWTQKLALAAFLQPLVSVFLSTRQGQQHIIKPLRRCFRMSEVATLDLDTQWAMVLSQLELLMCIGPFVPLSLPLGPHVCCSVIAGFDPNHPHLLLPLASSPNLCL